MIAAARAGAVALAVTMLSACASAPKDSGFADVQKAIAEQTGQPVKWDPKQPVTPADDAMVAALLQGELTVDRAVEVAFANNREVQATLEELGIARAELLAAGTIRNPLFHAEFRLPGSPRVPLELGLVQSIVDLLRLGNRKKLGQAQFDVAKVRVSAAVISFAAEVRTSYFDLLAARKVLARQDSILKAQEAAAELARRQHIAGNISDLDLENEQARYEQAKLDHARAQLDELTAREHLGMNLGLVERADLELPDEFPPLTAAEPTEADIAAQVIARRLDIRMAQGEIDAARRAVGIARTAAIDDLDLGVHLEREPDGKETTGPSVEVSIPVFNRGKAQKERARAMLRQAEQRLAALTAMARSEARAARENLLEARARATYLREVVIPRRDRILKLTQLEYNAMLTGVFQLLQARQNLAHAQREEVIASRDYWVARTGLDAALLGVSQFSVRREGSGPRRPDLFPPLEQERMKESE